MPIEFSCTNPNCKRKLSISDDKRGKKVRCPKCKEVVQAPGHDESEPSSLEVLEPILAARGTGLAAAIETGKELARGGMGQVMLCNDKGLGRQVAMKVMRARIAGSQEHQIRFLEEAQVTGQLEHPNIVPVHELGKDEEGNLYFTMKLVKGRSLGQMLKEVSGVGAQVSGKEAATPRVPTLSELLSIFQKTCDAMAFAHSKSVIHRDLKPDNIMVGDFGEVLVMDWGLAKVLQPGSAGSQPASSAAPETEPAGSRSARDEAREGETVLGGKPVAPKSPAEVELGDSTSGDDAFQKVGTIAAGDSVRSVRSETDIAATMEGAIQGTPHYMPPEQAEGRVDQIDQRSDVYSLGAILYEMLTLKRPVEGSTPHEILLKVVDGKILPPEQRTPDRDVPKELSAITMKAMARNRRRRYHSVGDLQKDINLYLEGRAVSAKEDTFSEAVTKLIKRNKGVASAAGVALAIICLVVGVAFQRVSHQRDQAEVAQEKAEISEQKAKTSEARATEAYRQQQRDAMAASKRFSLQAVRTAETGRFVETERRIADAESVLKNSPWILFARGKYAEARKDYEEAEILYRKAIDEDESITEARNALAELKALKGDLTNAEELIAGIENETDWKNLLRAAKLLYRAGKWSDSAKVNERAVALMEQAADSATEKDNKLLQGLLEEARYSIGDARAAEACVGFYDQVKGRLRHEQSGAVARKLIEINQKQKGVNQFLWSYTDTTNRFLVVSIHHDDELKYIHPLSGFPIQKLTLTNHRKLRQVHALIGMPLKYLDIRATPVTDLSPLNRLPLEYLNISFQPIQEITALRGMNLKQLDVSDTRVTDLSPLSEMSSLESLSIVHIWPMKDISPLRGLKLKHLYATYTSIVDISPLAGMSLETLTLYHTPVKDISVLRGMKLKRLDASHHTTDLSPIEGMPLQYLDVRDSSVFKIDIVKDMPLEIFNCSGTLRTETLAPLAGKKLKECYFERTKVSDLSPLAGMPITRLGFNFTKVSDLSPLKSMPLDRLEFVDTPVSNITPLAGAPIRNLNLTGTKVSDLSPLTDCTQLYTLDMNKTLVSDLSPLKKVLTLNRLQVASTKVSDLFPLQDTNISELNIAHTPITDLTPLEGMKMIAFLTVSAGQEFTPESKALVEKLKAKGRFKVTVVKTQ